MAANRTGLILFDPLDIIEGTRLRRDLLLVDAIAIADIQLQSAKSYAELLCRLYDKDPTQLLGQFDRTLDYLLERGLLEEVSIYNAVLPDEVQSEVASIEEVARRHIETRPFRPYLLECSDGSSIWVYPAGSHFLNQTRANLLRARWLAADSSTCPPQKIGSHDFARSLQGICGMIATSCLLPPSSLELIANLVVYLGSVRHRHP